MYKAAKDKTTHPELIPISITPPQCTKAQFRFSANRHLASYKVRYIETSNNSQECSLCELSH
ncbi:hypothetical protein [Shewanella psychrotolerans]|uniref:hypothetical protein n=1 Tax=Shewanella psychrotolerans TaxID=2864206 RepID=UPI001C659BAC|nr:hypothetical protein [Shewanella psychrotolerans]QYK03410.1 hypothetical protein K0I62_01535 [Shewanella psychrotolerans]